MTTRGPNTATPTVRARVAQRQARSHVRLADIIPLATVGPRTRRLRSALTTIGVAIGIAAIVAVLGIAESSRADLLAQLEALGTNHLEIRPGQSVSGDAVSLPATASNRVRRLDPIQNAASLATLTAPVRRSELIADTTTRGITTAATDVDLIDTIGATIVTGRWHDPASIQYTTVVLGSVAAERLGITTTGRSVLIGDTYFAVIGILRPIPLYATLDSYAFVGYPAAASLTDAFLDPSTVYVTSHPGFVGPVRAILPATVDPLHPEQITVSNPSDALAARQVVDDTLTTLLLALGGVALLVAGIGIANILVIGVLERRTEIGVRRALGATRGHIRTQFLLEAIILGTSGGLLGTLAGTAITYAYTQWHHLTFAIPPSSYALGIGAATIIGALAGLSPATRAARLAPADAIRPA